MWKYTELTEHVLVHITGCYNVQVYINVQVWNLVQNFKSGHYQAWQSNGKWLAEDRGPFLLNMFGVKCGR